MLCSRRLDGPASRILDTFRLEQVRFPRVFKAARRGPHAVASFRPSPTAAPRSAVSIDSSRLGGFGNIPGLNLLSGGHCHQEVVAFEGGLAGGAELGAGGGGSITFVIWSSKPASPC